MVSARMISPVEFRTKRILSTHTQLSLALALGTSEKTIWNFENGETRCMLGVRWVEVERELRLVAA